MFSDGGRRDASDFTFLSLLCVFFHNNVIFTRAALFRGEASVGYIPIEKIQGLTQYNLRMFLPHNRFAGQGISDVTTFSEQHPQKYFQPPVLYTLLNKISATFISFSKKNKVLCAWHVFCFTYYEVFILAAEKRG
jgi:hypothetical protein